MPEERGYMPEERSYMPEVGYDRNRNYGSYEPEPELTFEIPGPELLCQNSSFG